MLDDKAIHRIATARVGQTLSGRWTLEALLGVGGMAAVYRARHRNGAAVAVKMLHRTLAETTEIRQRFTNEGYVANKIAHPAVVRVHDDDEDDDGTPFFVMDLIEGETLAAKVQLRRMNDDELLDVAEQVSDALVAAHAAGVVHRDLKPDNLIMEADGRIRVLDFGIARLIEENDSQSMMATRTGIAFGTPGFTAPEQAMGKRREVGPRTDVFALGATLFYLATGDFVHDAETPQELLITIATQPARSLLDLAPQLSPEVVALVDRATRLAPSDRWPSAAAMLEAVRRVKAVRAGTLSDAPLPATNPSVNRDTETLVPPAPELAAGEENLVPDPFPSPPAITGTRPASGGSAIAHAALAARNTPATRESPARGSGRDSTFRAQMLRSSFLPTRPSLARARRHRSFAALGVAAACVTAAFFFGASTRATPRSAASPAITLASELSPQTADTDSSLPATTVATAEMTTAPEPSTAPPLTPIATKSSPAKPPSPPSRLRRTSTPGKPKIEPKVLDELVGNHSKLPGIGY